MEAIKGDNLKKGIDKLNHVKASTGKALTSLVDSYSYAFIATLEQLLREKSFFLFFNMQ